MAFVIGRVFLFVAAIAVKSQLLLPPLSDFSQAMEDVQKLVCDDVQKGKETRTAVTRFCPDLHRRFPALQQVECETLWTLLKDKCSEVSPSTTTTTAIPTRLVQTNSAGKSRKTFESLFRMARVVLPNAVPVVQKAVGLPSEHELVCNSLKNGKLENRTQEILCGMALNDLSDEFTAKMCRDVVSAAWRQEAAEQRCPEAPDAWGPFHFVNKLGQRLLCTELKDGRLVGKEHNISAEACLELADNEINQWACQIATESVLENYKRQCSDHPIVDTVSDLMEQTGIFV